jgi:hypothetical protein
MLTPRNANQFTIADRMTATHERQGPRPLAPIVRDEALRLGPAGQLVGIVSHPASQGQTVLPSSVPATAVIILNAGVLHRVGPHRLHVQLARRLAGLGLPGLRLDLGGIGDSIASSDAMSFRDSAVADTRVAMTGLTEAVGAQRFVLFGVCSGADNSLATALVDDRVAGIVLVDPPVYPTRRSQLRNLRARAAKSGSARELLRTGLDVAARELRRAAARFGRYPIDAPPGEGRELPPVTVFGDQLAELAARGVAIFAVYSGIHGARYNHRDQIFELFPELRGRIDHAYFPSANHTFTELAAQAELLDAVTGWVTRRFG